MKTLLTTIIAALVITGSAFAQRVNNGDPGLALSSAGALPKGSAFETLLAAYERGTIPSFTVMSKKGFSGSMVDAFIIDNENKDKYISDLKSSYLNCKIRNNGPLLEEQLFCSFSRENTFEYKVDYESNSLKGLYYSFREYQKMIIFILSPSANGLCFNPSDSHKIFPINGICGVGYLYK
ncbi:MAG: hypothetical protein L6Q37_11575 [Bdellovibrionaceae bacterium]|nr:hypothetical protein [Pseudobdellovibrionaceae bacterium]NUM59650.1 hypothetical protein [Pseudobdellovibrionaceae bacterium]